MLCLLFWLYFVVILFVGVLIIFIQLLFDWIFYECGVQVQCDLLMIYLFVLNDYFECYLGVQCEFVLCELVLYGCEGFGFMLMVDVCVQLSGVLLCDFDVGKIVISYNGKDYYMLFVDGLVLYVCLIEVLDFDICIYVYMLFVFVMLFVVVLWIYYYWCDICWLQDVVCVFGVGMLLMCVKLLGKLNIYELLQQFNDMVVCIEVLIKQQCEMMYGILYELKMLFVWFEFGFVLFVDFDEMGWMCECCDVLWCDVCEFDEFVIELLMIGWFEQGVSEFVLMEVVVDVLIDSVVGNVVDDIVDCGIVFDVLMFDVFVIYVCDLKFVVCVLLNLICNGVCYVLCKVLLVVICDWFGVFVLSVDDDGFGILVVECVCVFELFQWLDLSCDWQIGGFGFGFVIVWCVVQVYGGDVWFEDLLFGGVCFVIMFFVCVLLDCFFDVVQYVESMYVDVCCCSGMGMVVLL